MDIEKICKIIKDKINKNEFDELQDLLTEEVVVTKNFINKDTDNLTNKYFNVCRNGDILVGFYLEPNNNKKELLITYGGRSIDNLILYPGQYTYFLNNKYMFPFISVQYSEIHVNEISNDFSGISYIFALLQKTELRRTLATSTVLFKEINTIIKHSCFYNLKNKDDIDRDIIIIEFPDMSIL